jgi:hypothetical protein
LTERLAAFPGRVVFDHRPKTAGQAINRWLTRRLGAGCVTPNLVCSHRELIARYGGMFSVLSGHIFYDDFESLDPRYRYLTVLRHPVERALSWLRYLANDVPEIEATIELRAGALRFIASDGAETTGPLLESLSNPYVTHFCGVGGTRAMPPRQQVDCAVATLGQYDIVGIYEQLPGFAAEVATLIGGSKWPALERVNVTTDRHGNEGESPALRRRLEELNALDLELYGTASREWPRKRRVALPIGSALAELDWVCCDLPPPRDGCITSPDAIIGGATLRGTAPLVQGTLATFDVDILLGREVDDLVLGVHVLDSQEALAFGTNTHLLRQALGRTGPGSYRVSYTVAMDLACGGYTIGFGIAEQTTGGPVTLALARQWLGFDVVPLGESTFTGYARLPTSVRIEPTSIASAWGAVAKPHGSVTLAAPIPTRITPAQRLSLHLKIENTGAQPWAGDLFRPINAACRWVDADVERGDRDGARIGCVQEAVAPGAPVIIAVETITPTQPGRCLLDISLVQETVGWFDKMGGGFEPLRMPVDVVAA